MNSVWFLQSKRFWSLPVGAVIAQLVARLGAAGLEIAPDDATALANILTAIVVWVVGMTMGKRGVSLKPKPKTNTEGR